VVKTLRRYAQFSRISVDLDLRENAIVGHYGRSDSSAEKTPVGERLLTSIDGATVRLTRGASLGEIISVDPQSPVDLSDVVKEARTGHPENWSMEVIASGHYALQLEDSEAFTPQALNYDITGLVAFDKGCYTGQEIIARLHYKGRSKKRLHRYIVSGDVSTLARDTRVLTSQKEHAGRCLRVFRAADADSLVAAEVAREHLNEEMFLPTGEPLRSIDFTYPETV